MTTLTEPNCTNCPNSNCFINKNCSEEWLLLVNDKKKHFKRKSGQAIIYAGMSLQSLYFIYEGKVKVVADGLFGKQQIKRLTKPGDILGFRELDGNHICSSSVYAIEDSLICSVERDFFLEVLKANPEMMLETLLLLTKELRTSEWRMKNLTLMNVREKISHSLLYMHEVFGNIPGGEIDVKLTRQEIGEIACTSKELVSRTLSDFEEEEIIRTEGKKIFLLNLQELKNMIGVNEDVSL
ncbi:MAG: Crp/Fnr family transcriptional regulator [Bacteroidia bacterium]